MFLNDWSDNEKVHLNNYVNILLRQFQKFHSLWHPIIICFSFIFELWILDYNPLWGKVWKNILSIYLYYDYVKKSTNMKKYWVKTNWENLFSMNLFWLFKTSTGITFCNKIFHFATEWDTFARGDDQRDNKAGASAKTFSLSM